MGSFRLEARAEWRANGNQGSQSNIPLDAVVTGATANGFSSNDAKTPGEMIRLFDMADGAAALTVLLKAPYAHMYFPTNRALDFISIGVHDARTDKIVVTATGKDIKVLHSAPNSDGAGQVVLDLHGDGISASKA